MPQTLSPNAGLDAALSADSLLGVLEARYATKQFDSSRKIDGATWDALEKSLVLSPSSFGLQPWKFLVVTDEALKAELLPHAWGQPSVTSSSHLVVFLAKKSLGEEDVERLIGANAEVRGLPRESLEGYAGMIKGTLSQRSPEEILEWNKRQAYIALGQFVVSAALLGVDACPMEGFLPAEFDRILGVEGYTAAVIATAGYRSPDDKYAHLPKVRYSQDELVERR